MSSMRSSISNSRHQIALVLVSLGTFGIYQISYFWLVQIVLNFLYILDETAASRVVCCEACLHWHIGGHDSTSKDHQTAFPQFHYIWKDTVEKSQQASSKVNLLFCSVLTRLNEQVRDRHDFSSFLSFTQFTCWSKHALLEFWKKMSRPTHIPNTHTYIDKRLTCTFSSFHLNLDFGPLSPELWRGDLKTDRCLTFIWSFCPLLCPPTTFTFKFPRLTTIHIFVNLSFNS